MSKSTKRPTELYTTKYTYPIEPTTYKKIAIALQFSKCEPISLIEKSNTIIIEISGKKTQKYHFKRIMRTL